MSLGHLNGNIMTYIIIPITFERRHEAALRTGLPYQAHLDPPPADLRCCHLGRRSAL